MAKAFCQCGARGVPALALRRSLVEQATRVRRLVVTAANPNDQTTFWVRFGRGPLSQRICARMPDSQPSALLTASRLVFFSSSVP